MRVIGSCLRARNFFIVFICLAFLQVLPLRLAAQGRHMKDTLCMPSAKPIMMTRGQKFMVRCDTAWLINNFRYQTYEKARQYVLSIDPAAREQNLKDMEKTVEATEKKYTELLSKYQTLSSDYEQNITNNQSTLVKTKVDLELAARQLTAAQHDLEEAQRLLRKEKFNKHSHSLLWGAGGLFTGILLGFIIH